MVWQPMRKVKLRFCLADLRTQIAYSAPYGFATLGVLLNNQLDKVWAALFYPPAIFALYAAGAFEIPLAGIASGPVVAVIMGDLTKRFISGDIEGFLRLWHQSIVKLALPIFGIATFFMVFAEPIVVGMFSSGYADSIGVFRVYLLFLPMHITVLYQVLASLGETKAILRAQVLSLSINVVFGYLLIRTLGWLGPAIAAVVSGYLFAILLIWEIKKRLNVKVSQLAPWKGLTRVGVVAIVAGLGSWPVMFLRIGSMWKLTLGLLVFSTIYLIGNLKINSITNVDLQILRGWISMTSKTSMGKEALQNESLK
jgi:O-antigen/teichoic acid export membrane protein